MPTSSEIPTTQPSPDRSDDWRYFVCGEPTTATNYLIEGQPYRAVGHNYILFAWPQDPAVGFGSGEVVDSPEAVRAFTFPTVRTVGYRALLSALDASGCRHGFFGGQPYNVSALGRAMTRIKYPDRPEEIEIGWGPCGAQGQGQVLVLRCPSWRLVLQKLDSAPIPFDFDSWGTPS